MRLKTIKAKVIALLLLGLVSVAVIAGLGILSDSMIEIDVRLAEQVAQIDSDVLKLMMLEAKYLNRPEDSIFQAVNKTAQHLDEGIKLAGSMSDNAEINKLLVQLTESRKSHDQAFKQSVETVLKTDRDRTESSKKMAELDDELQKTIDAITEEETMATMQGDDLDGLKASLRDVYKNLIIINGNGSNNIMSLFVLNDEENYRTRHSDFAERLKLETKNASMAVASLKNPKLNGVWDRVSATMTRMDQLENDLFSGWSKKNLLDKSLAETTDNMNSITGTILKAVGVQTDKKKDFNNLLNLIVMVLSFAAMLGLGFFIVRSVQSSLRKALAGIDDAARQVATAANEVASSSNSLAEDAGHQAASLEETSSALEEISSMTKANAENATKAEATTSASKKGMTQTNESMGELMEAMNEIAEAGGEISKIVKSIDEIAFQTNLLALNAAVEAARAGEAGAGFAVVADEVRALAIRAADAAGNTQELIELTVNRIEKGSELVESSRAAFGQSRGRFRPGCGIDHRDRRRILRTDRRDQPGQPGHGRSGSDNPGQRGQGRGDGRLFGGDDGSVGTTQGLCPGSVRPHRGKKPKGGATRTSRNTTILISISPCPLLRPCPNRIKGFEVRSLGRRTRGSHLKPTVPRLPVPTQ